MASEKNILDVMQGAFMDTFLKECKVPSNDDPVTVTSPVAILDGDAREYDEREIELTFATWHRSYDVFETYFYVRIPGHNGRQTFRFRMTNYVMCIEEVYSGKYEFDANVQKFVEMFTPGPIRLEKGMYVWQILFYMLAAALKEKEAA